jgi:hypothetical protein
MKVPILFALIFAGYHVLFIVVPLVASGGSGEGQAMAVAISDFPLTYLLEHIPGGIDILYSPAKNRQYIWFYSLAGTLLYFASGCLLGLLIIGIRAFVRIITRRRY